MGLDLPWEGAGLKQGPGPSVGALEAEETVQGTEKHLRLRVKQLVCERLNGMRITETNLAAAIHSPERDAGTHVPWEAQGWELERRDPAAIPGRGQLLTAGRRPRGREGGVGSGKRLSRKPGQPGRQGHLLSHSQAVEPLLWPLCPYMSALESGRLQREAGLLLPSRGREPGAEKDRPGGAVTTAARGQDDTLEGQSSLG